MKLRNIISAISTYLLRCPQTRSVCVQRVPDNRVRAEKSIGSVILRPVYSFFLLVLLSACAGPELRLNSLAQDFGFTREIARSEQFSHVVFRNFESLESGKLSVYLEGDGSPWLLRYIRMPDPTPRSPMMLKMMALDHQPSLYLGRPCYNGFADSSACNNSLWTSGRYSSAVVNSMLAVLQDYVRRYRVDTVYLYGHSGGGTLAMLLAERLASVRRVVTLAGNLDIDAWTELHGYAPLLTSLNPVRRPPLPNTIQRIHFMGGRDKNIPPSLASPWLARQRNTAAVVMQSFDHGCCWQRQWPAILDSLQAGPPFRWPEEVVNTLQ